jgi:hypothetical protein
MSSNVWRRSMREQRRIIRIVSVAFGSMLAIAFPAAAFAEWCTMSPLNVPISLAVGHVRTPEFKAGWSGLEDFGITVKTVFPPAELSCKIGISEGPKDPVDCNNEPLIEADWTVSSGGHIVARGSSRDTVKDGYYKGDTFGRYIGSFKVNKHKTYVIDMNFTRDGSALAVADPHLLVSSGGWYYHPIRRSPNVDTETLFSKYLLLRPGHFHSPEFEGHEGLNLINFDVLGRLPANRLFCLIGTQPTGQQACAEESVLDFDWTVWSEGKIVATGTSRPFDQEREYSMSSMDIRECGGVSRILRNLGSFPGRKGQKFSIELNIKKDGSKLDVALPRLWIQKGYPASGFGM